MDQAGSADHQVKARHSRILGLIGAPVHDTIAIVISLFSLLISSLNYYYQNHSTYQVMYKIDNDLLSFYGRSSSNVRPIGIFVRINFYNLGNRPVAIDNVRLFIVNHRIDKNEIKVPAICPSVDEIEKSRSGLGSLINPLDSTYMITESGTDFEKFDGFIEQPNSIISRRVFISPYEKTYMGPFYLEGVLCVDISGTDWKGNRAEATQEIASIKVDAPKQIIRRREVFPKKIRYYEIVNTVVDHPSAKRSMNLINEG